MLLLGVLFILAPVYSQLVNVNETIGNVYSNPCTDKNHLVLAPGVLTAGGTNRACVSRFHPEGAARLLLTLFTEDRQTTTASRDLPPGDGGCLDINVPQVPNSKADLIVNIRYTEAQCVWERRLPLRVSSGRVLVVQTERARYRPGETVRARVLALKPDLAPSHGVIEEAWLEGPRGAWEGTRVTQWLRVPTRLGLAQLQYQLDDRAPPGKWTLRARLGDGSQGTSVFWVGNYELPPFQLSVRHAPRVLRTSERLVWTVCVRYPWSEAVEGMLVIRLRGAGGGGTGVRTAVQLRAPKACHRHAVAAKRVGLHSQNPPDVLVADFSFQEEGTRIWQNTTVVSQVIDKPISLEFLTKHRAVISPGLPYKLKIKATRWDDKPATSEHIRVCRYPTQHAELSRPARDVTAGAHDMCAEGQTDAGGVARVMFAAVRGEAPLYKFEAQLSNDSSTTASLLVRVRGGAVQAALGPLKADSRTSHTLVPLYINTHVATPLTVHFVVITRGGIIYRWGATTQCPTSTSADKIHTAPRNGKCNANYYGYNQDVMAQRDDLAHYDDIALKKRSSRHRRTVNVPINDTEKAEIHSTREIIGNYHDSVSKNYANTAEIYSTSTLGQSLENGEFGLEKVSTHSQSSGGRSGHQQSIPQYVPNRTEYQNPGQFSSVPANNPYGRDIYSAPSHSRSGFGALNEQETVPNDPNRPEKMSTTGQFSSADRLGQKNVPEYTKGDRNLRYSTPSLWSTEKHVHQQENVPERILKNSTPFSSENDPNAIQNPGLKTESAGIQEYRTTTAEQSRLLASQSYRRSGISDYWHPEIDPNSIPKTTTSRSGKDHTSSQMIDQFSPENDPNAIHTGLWHGQNVQNTIAANDWTPQSNPWELKVPQYHSRTPNIGNQHLTPPSRTNSPNLNEQHWTLAPSHTTNIGNQHLTQPSHTTNIGNQRLTQVSHTTNIGNQPSHITNIGNQHLTQPPHTTNNNQYTNQPNVGQYWSPNDVNSRTDDVSNVTSDALLDRKLKVMLPIKVSHQMCPDSHLIAYFYYNGELVSASKHFEMDDCFANKVEATWVNRQVSPGSQVSLSVTTPGPALCALTVLDSAAKWTQPPATTKDLVMTSLKRLIDSHRNITEYDAAGECFLNSDPPETPSSAIELTSTWLASAGVRLLGGEAPREAIKRCEARAPAALVTEEVAPRSDFSEAWLWRLLPISAKGSGVATGRAPDSITRFEAGVTCVSRTGVAVSPPALLQVFREFFIHADSPKRLRRGDSAIIRYRIFNYLYEPLSVQIQILTDPHIEVPSDLVETACVGARSSVARRLLIKARVASPARLSLRAKAVSDGNCPNVTSTATVSDEVIIRIAVDPEGVPVHEQKSILLCGNASGNAGTSQVEWTWPIVNAVPRTETLTLWTVGDVTGPLLADADSLLLIPRGCGEQNMAQLATNLLALKQLDPTSIAALTAREHVARGFTRQLQYVHPSGGFSAFGPSDATSSTWLTAFAVRHLRKAHQVLWPNIQVPAAIIRAERWLLTQQMENGCFRNEGQVFHRELRGGLNEEGEIASVALTAYVITSLIESTSPLPYRVITNTLSCLRALPPLKTLSPTRVYAHALLAYAYMRLEQYESDLRKTNKVSLLKSAGLEDEGEREVMELLRVAKRSGGYVWWEASSLSTSIEATSYALLALRSGPASRGASDVTPAMRWLAAHRTVGGGFVATQDTLVALEALTAWSSSIPRSSVNVTARCDNSARSVTIHPAHYIPDVVTLTPGERLSVTVQGTGCALVQATRSYNTLSPAPSTDKLLSVQVTVHTDGPFDCDANNTSCFCAAVIEACVMWSTSFPEMALLEVYLPGGYGADAQLLYSQLNKPGSLLRRIEVPASNNRATLYLGRRGAGAGGAGHQCYSVHAVGPRANTRPAYVRVHDYYVPSHNDTQPYTIPEDCPPRITHDTPQYTSSENLYTKARSLEGDEILISQEFSFEELPEGIPLEDPLYDNLTKKEKDSNTNEKDSNNVFNIVDVASKEDGNVSAISKQNLGFIDKFTLNNIEGTRFKPTEDNKRNNEIKNLETTKKPEEIKVDNPNLADFHVIDSEKDLDVPTGVEGPIPTIVLPPKNFIPPPSDDGRRFKSMYTPHGPYFYFRPEEYINRRLFIPRGPNSYVFPFGRNVR
ncbi:uncharacterized protein LOC142979828 [Anticarsia gemmatalis]|uniref:uncharacterized protein LOC142979828 n=1 Tax=Anticarsia gemmatalis TaxID=129554 RepID=UPI003F7663ED